MISRLLGLAGLALLLFACGAPDGRRQAVAECDVVRTAYEPDGAVPLYQGNGRFGGCYSQFGLHAGPGRRGVEDKYGKTQFTHLGHYIRGHCGADYLMPLASIYWQDDFTRPAGYSQRQSYYNGVIETRFEASGSRIGVTTWFDTSDLDLAGVCIHLEGQPQTVVVDPGEVLTLHYGQEVVRMATYTPAGEGWEVEVVSRADTSRLWVASSAPAAPRDGRLYVDLLEGDNWITMCYGHPASASADQSLARTKKAWNARWEGAGWVELPDPAAQSAWVRTMGLFFATFAPGAGDFSPPMGLAGNMWPFAFPQDLSYIHPVLLSTGEMEVARDWIERWSADLGAMEGYTRRLIGADGVMCPWTYPYGGLAGFHDPSPPNVFYYEIHNSGYLARMAHETAVMLDDPAWSERYAKPIIESTARFYRSVSSRGEEGRWHVFALPSMGQDEMGGVDKRDYLCALYSAEYCFQRAVEYGLDTQGEYQKILDDGLAFDGLLSPQGFYWSCADGEGDLGAQKHPVQLNPLAYLPVDKEISGPAAEAYRQRYTITKDASQPFFYGWTLGEFLLAGSRYGDPEQWMRDWDNIVPSGYTDKERVQFYETSGQTHTSYYTTTHGLVAQSLLNNVVCDFFSRLDIARCYPWQGDTHLEGVRSLLGVTVSGTVGPHRAELTLTAWKDADFEMHGERVRLKKGESVRKYLKY